MAKVRNTIAEFRPRTMIDHVLFWSILGLPVVALVFNLQQDFFFTLPFCWAAVYIASRATLHRPNAVAGVIGRPLRIVAIATFFLCILVLGSILIFDW